jgi:carnitine 3-dehydrogenase
MRTDVRRVALVGAGVIGNAWAAYLLARGLEVAVTDPDPRAGERLRRDVDRALPVLAQFGPVADGCVDRLVFTADLAAAVGGADFVQENAPERDEVKAAIFAELDALVPPDVVVASSSSSMLPSRLAAMCSRHPGRVIVGHPFNPVYLIPLVEVVGGEATAPEAVAWASEFYALAGKQVITMDREVPGFIANRLQEALWREALHMVDSGEATVEQIDLAITAGPGLRWPIHGPMLTFHLAGGAGGMAHMLDHFGPSLKSPWTRLDAPELTPDLRDAVVNGCLDEAGDRTIADLVAERDAKLIAVMRALETTTVGEGH